jgi:hypothetical protein
MKKIVPTIAVLVLSAGLAAAQDMNPSKTTPAMGPARGMLEEALVASETRLNAAVAKGDVVAFKGLVAPDAWSADAGGFMKVSDFAAMMPQVKVNEWKISDPKVTWLDANTALVTYTWTGSGTMNGTAFGGPTYCSTVWTKKAGKWLAAYHQETEARK